MNAIVRDSTGWWLGWWLYESLYKGCTIGDGRGCIMLSMIDKEKVWLGGFKVKGDVNSSNTTCLRCRFLHQDLSINNLCGHRYN